ncbi:GntR family transcriptional regulator [Paenibacillus sp. OAS669]|uniref:GntR family transcriptional regulator n=1 Tax=Paenibacillus sp. OAS669 TaxID=2663821 RepID=UPI00178A1B19|nr:GntR family transcriptional regulator [Paenibacillus sp. OAS669]MBE1445368.1 DNA-binding GntR family transcriptional regulator [Paenibacillus sp. OAS669]
MELHLHSARDNKGLIRDYVHSTLKKNIMELRLEPGRFISEKDVIEMLQVSRTPIREAFVKLAQEELIETVPQKGSFISLIDWQHVEESRFIRETLESAVVREACTVLSSEQVLHLQNLINLQQLCAAEKNYERLFELDEEFHKAIITGCGKIRTWNMIQQMSTHYNRVRFLRLASNTDWESILEQHQGLVQAIRDKREDAAGKIMKEHLSMGDIDKDQLKEKYPAYFK